MIGPICPNRGSDVRHQRRKIDTFTFNRKILFDIHKLRKKHELVKNEIEKANCRSCQNDVSEKPTPAQLFRGEL
jgi:hypothetical protein